MSIKSGSYKIRPAGRHLLTIGRDLIQDSYAAVVELVKNSYDADASHVEIRFEANSDEQSVKISISDDGHGMSRDVILNKWMVPSTDDKLKRGKSPKGRLMQGRKGIGRYAASILGESMLLETVSDDKEQTTLLVEWDDFDRAEFLDDVELLIETQPSKLETGTNLTITGATDYLQEWDKTQFDQLRFELKKLMPTIRAKSSPTNFQILLSIRGFEYGDLEETVEPFPITNLFDYKISGVVKASGQAILLYSCQKSRNVADEEIRIDFKKMGIPSIGELQIDIRVYDRDGDSIRGLIERGLKDESGNYVGKLEARRILSQSNGVGVYRNGFRIRPLGDPDFDWLKLNEQRIQDPSRKIGSNQVIGVVSIQSEENSGLIEKSARDGLKDNRSFRILKRITATIIAELEQRRFVYRRMAGTRNLNLKVEREIEKLFSIEKVKKDIQGRLDKSGVGKNLSADIIDIISKDSIQKSEAVEKIRNAVAVYQGQATLGKIVNVVLHEGRRPLNYFRNQVPNIEHWHRSYEKTPTKENLSKIIPIAKGLGKNAKFFVDLLNRLDPLAAGNRPAKTQFTLQDVLSDVTDLFEAKINKLSTEIEISGSADLKFLGWEQDIYIIFANLIDNSLYWIEEKNSKSPEITIKIRSEGGKLKYIDYRDTGPGIDPKLIKSNVIFDPEFSTKPDGTGLGLAIAGEAATRNGFELQALESELGVYFRLQYSNDEDENDI